MVYYNLVYFFVTIEKKQKDRTSAKLLPDEDYARASRGIEFTRRRRDFH
jgi:hypothetical protein